MTNIVGGSTNNLTQSGASQDTNNSLISGEIKGLDFLQLISVALDKPKEPNGSENDEFVTKDFLSNSSEIVPDDAKSLVANALNIVSSDGLQNSKSLVSILQGLQSKPEGKASWEDISLTASNLLTRLVSDIEKSETNPVVLKTTLSPELIQEITKYSELQEELLNFLESPETYILNNSINSLGSTNNEIASNTSDQPVSVESFLVRSELSELVDIEENKYKNQAISPSILSALSFEKIEEKPVLLNLKDFVEIKPTNLASFTPSVIDEVKPSVSEEIQPLNITEVDPLALDKVQSSISDETQPLNLVNVASSLTVETETSKLAEVEPVILDKIKSSSTKDNKLTKIFLNSDNSNDITVADKTALELNVIFNNSEVEVRLHEMGDDNTNPVKEVLEISEIASNASKDKSAKALMLEVPNNNLAMLVINIDKSLAELSTTEEIPISFKFMENQEADKAPSNKYVEFSAGNEAISKIIQKTNITGVVVNDAVQSKPITPQPGTTSELNYIPDIPTEETIENKPAIRNLTNKLDGNSNQFSDDFVTETDFELPSKDLLDFVKEKLKERNETLTKELTTKSKVINFIKNNEGTASINVAVLSITKNEFKGFENLALKKKLLVSTADVISSRAKFSNSSTGEKILVRSTDGMISKSDNLNIEVDKINNLSGELSEKVDTASLINDQLKKNNFSQLDLLQNKGDQVAAKFQSTNLGISQAKLSILDAQFSARLAANLLEQAIHSKENFDLILEPENFGKVRVNVSLENLQLDVKLTAENSATLAVLRASESVLQSITELNGLKLAEYNVELNNNLQNNNGFKGQKEQNSKSTADINENLENSEDSSEIFSDDSSHSLNLMA